MSGRFAGMSGMSLRDEALLGVPDAEKPDLRAALVSRLGDLASAGPEGNEEVLAIKDAIDAAFPGEPYYLALKFS
jgi:hypothetical protein